MTENAAETYHRMSTTDPDAVALRAAAGLDKAQLAEFVELGRTIPGAHRLAADQARERAAAKARLAAEREAYVAAVRSMGIAFELVTWARRQPVRLDLGRVRLGVVAARAEAQATELGVRFRESIAQWRDAMGIPRAVDGVRLPAPVDEPAGAMVRGTTVLA